MTVGSGYSVPVVAGDRVFVHAQAGTEEAEEAICVDAKSGKEIWRKAYPRAVYKSAISSGPRSTPTYVDGKLYTFGITGVLTCFDGANGAIVWQKNPYTDFGASLPGFGVCGSALVFAGKVIVPVGGPGSSIVALDAKTGAVVWKILDEPASCASPIAVANSAGKDKFDIVVQTSLRILGLNPDDGSVRWEHPLVFQPSGVSPTPLATNGILTCTTQDSGTLSLKLGASAPDLLWWDHKSKSYFSTGGVGENGQVFVVVNQIKSLPRADLVALDAKTGKIGWKQTGLGYFHLGLIVVAEQKLLILSDAGNLSLVDVKQGFKQLASSKICGGTFSNPVLANGLFYFRDGKEMGCVQLKP